MASAAQRTLDTLTRTAEAASANLKKAMEHTPAKSTLSLGAAVAEGSDVAKILLKFGKGDPARRVYKAMKQALEDLRDLEDALAELPSAQAAAAPAHERSVIAVGAVIPDISATMHRRRPTIHPVWGLGHALSNHFKDVVKDMSVQVTWWVSLYVNLLCGITKALPKITIAGVFTLGLCMISVLVTEPAYASELFYTLGSSIPAAVGTYTLEVMKHTGRTALRHLGVRTFDKQAPLAQPCPELIPCTCPLCTCPACVRESLEAGTGQATTYIPVPVPVPAPGPPPAPDGPPLFVYMTISPLLAFVIGKWQSGGATAA